MRTQSESRARSAVTTAMLISGLVGLGAAAMALATASGRLGYPSDTRDYVAIAVIGILVFVGNAAVRRFLLPRD